MWIWTGWGLLAPAFGVLGLVATAYSVIWFGPEGGLPAIMGGIVASFGCWFAGTRLGGGFMFVSMKAYAFIYAALFGILAALPYK
jgi:hypothetical protein